MHKINSIHFLMISIMLLLTAWFVSIDVLKSCMLSIGIMLLFFYKNHREWRNSFDFGTPTRSSNETLEVACKYTFYCMIALSGMIYMFFCVFLPIWCRILIVVFLTMYFLIQLNRVRLFFNLSIVTHLMIKRKVDVSQLLEP